MAVHWEEGASGMEMGKKQIIIPGSQHRGDESSEKLALKERKAEFHEFLQQQGLKTIVLKTNRFGSGTAWVRGW